MNLLFTTNFCKNCANTSSAVTPFATNLTAAAAVNWDYTNNAGANWIPNIAQPVVHPAQATQTERFRTFYRIPPGYSGTYSLTFTGDKHDNGPNDPGYLYYDNVFVARTGLGNAVVVNLPVVPGLHALEWRHGIASGGATNLRVIFNYANVVYKQDCCNLQLTKCSQMRYSPTCLITPTATLINTKTSGVLQANVTANPNNYGIFNLPLTSDGDISGASYGGITRPANQNATGVVIRYTLPTVMDRIIRVNLWNNGGGVLNDFDGIGTATVTLRDINSNILFVGTIVGPNGGGIGVLNVLPEVNGVKYIFLSNITNLAGGAAPDILWRHIQVEAASLVDFEWTCGAFNLTAQFDSPDTTPTLVNGILTQTATSSPAILTFTSDYEFNGVIRTNLAADFSSLNITNNSQIVVTRTTAANTKWLLPFVTFVDKPVMTFASQCEGEPIIWRNAKGEFVPTEYLTECE